MKKFFIFIIIVAFFLAYIDSSEASRGTTIDHSKDSTTVVHHPRMAVDRPEQILERIAYSVSYNHETRCPNWVAWTLTAEHTDGPHTRKGIPYYNENLEAIGIGKVSKYILRSGYFVDTEVPAPRQDHSDWRVHPDGYDHGHMCPAADCKWDKGVMNQSLLLTNMCPQYHDLNSGTWDKLESRCRKWAQRYGRIEIVAGPVFNDGPYTTFGPNAVAIPDGFFKVILCTNGRPKAIAFLFNNNGERLSLARHVVTVDEVEDLTGIDFFHHLPDDVETTVESTSNLNKW